MKVYIYDAYNCQEDGGCDYNSTYTLTANDTSVFECGQSEACPYGTVVYYSNDDCNAYGPNDAFYDSLFFLINVFRFYQHNHSNMNVQ